LRGLKYLKVQESLASMEGEDDDDDDGEEEEDSEIFRCFGSAI
jgi:hypothetical protein